MHIFYTFEETNITPGIFKLTFLSKTVRRNACPLSQLASKPPPHRNYLFSQMSIFTYFEQCKSIAFFVSKLLTFVNNYVIIYV